MRVGGVVEQGAHLQIDWKLLILFKLNAPYSLYALCGMRLNPNLKPNPDPVRFGLTVFDDINAAIYMPHVIDRDKSVQL